MKNGDNLTASTTIFSLPPAADHREPVIINVPAPDTLTPDRRFKGEIEQFRDKALVLIADEAVDVATGMSAQGKDLMFLGKVVNCSAASDGRWAIHVHVNRTILVV